MNPLRALGRQIRRRNFLLVDLALASALAAGWVWFAYQYGFDNSPDSWYRGVLAKSIAEGHPYWVNLKQGYAYEYGPWHHDATHEPLLPAIYALSFLVFGTRIAVANVVSAASAGLLLFPLLRLSRALAGSAWPAIPVYAATVFNEQLGFLFEVLAGLSLPTALLLLVSFSWCLLRLVQTSERRWVLATALAAAGYYHVRAETQLILWWLAVWTLVLAAKMLAPEQRRRVRQMWALAFCLVLPWMLHKVIVFRNPFFTHMTPLMWTNRGYDYWSYHESMPLPTPASYFARHTVADLAHRIVVQGSRAVHEHFARGLGDQVHWYLAAFVVAAVLILIVADRGRRFAMAAIWLAGIGNVGILGMMTVLDTRYFLPPNWVLAFTLAAAPFLLLARWIRGGRGALLGGAMGMLLLGAVIGSQREFWQGFRAKYLRRSYQTADQRIANDKTVQALRQRLTPADAVLGPFAEVQYLAFATGLTFIEMPDNLRALNDPVAFFQKYGIRHALVDVTRMLPKAMIRDVELVGNRVLYTIGAGEGRRQADFFPEMQRMEGEAIRSAIAAGVRDRVVYVDGHHGAVPPDMGVFREAEVNAFAFRESYTGGNANKLLQSGLLVVQYAIGSASLSDAELAAIKQYVANGGRILLLCPAWVWLSYENRPLEELTHFKIARLFRLLLTGDYVEGPYRLVEPSLQVGGLPSRLTGTFSGIAGADVHPILVGRDDRTAAAWAEAGRARVVVWAQNDLLRDVALTPEGRDLLRRLLDWLLEPAAEP